MLMQLGKSSMENHIFAWLPHGMDLFWLFLLMVLLFGANKLPQLAKGLGKSLGEFKKAKEEFEKEVHAAADADTKVGDPAPHVSGNLPQPVTPAATPTTSTPVEASTKTT
jgi:sec-independent protein translocase protein TatA